MQFFNSTTWLVMVAFSTLVFSLPSLPRSNIEAIDEPFDDYYITQPGEADLLSKRLTSSTCHGLSVSLTEIATRANELCNAAISSIASSDPTEKDRFIHYFGSMNDNDNARALITHRYGLIKDTIFSLTLNLVCLPKEVKDGREGVIANVVSAGQGTPATVRLFKGFFGLADKDACDDGMTKATVFVHEAAHVFGADDRGPDKSNDAYQYGEFSSSAFGKCEFEDN